MCKKFNIQFIFTSVYYPIYLLILATITEASKEVFICSFILNTVPRSSHQGLTTAEEFPSLSTRSLCLLKVSWGSFSLSDTPAAYHSIHWRQFFNIPSLYLTHKHPPGHLLSLHLFHVAKPLKSLSLHFIYHSALLPFTQATHSKRQLIPSLLRKPHALLKQLISTASTVSLWLSFHVCLACVRVGTIAVFLRSLFTSMLTPLPFMIRPKDTAAFLPCNALSPVSYCTTMLTHNWSKSFKLINLLHFTIQNYFAFFFTFISHSTVLNKRGRTPLSKCVFLWRKKNHPQE